MSLDAPAVKRIARLARLAVREDELQPLAGEINAILGFVEQLKSVDVSSVEAMTSVRPMAMKMRDDTITDGGYPERVLKNAPQREDDFFVVPKVVE
jgi:aspartyl-tRNA(Asn)/glutamyl-tRNA(Gln) amidotransferase subunit C